MRILGLSAFHRDSAAALVVDGNVAAAAQEERFTRLALDPAFPKRALRWCLASAGISAGELDRAVFYEKPLRKFERVLYRSLTRFPRSARTFSKSTFLWLGERLWIRNRIAQDLDLPPERVLFVDQALAQLAHAFYTSPFEEAALLLLDDVCEWTTTAFGRGRGTELVLLREIRHPHSLGLFASAWTQFLGFAPGEEEHKLEALSAFGAPESRAADLERLFARRGDGEFELAPEPFRFDDGAPRLFSARLEDVFGPARRSGDPLLLGAPDARHADLAAGVQRALEERALALARELQRSVGGENLCLAGLLAQNRRLCARLLEEGPFRSLHVPLAGKSSGALGAALHAHHVLDPRAERREISSCDFGETIDERAEPGARELGTGPAPLQELARRLVAGEVVGWVRGAMEFGSRSLGRRVVLALARGPGVRRRLLDALRQVETFLPCRLAAPRERAAEFFELPALAEGLLRHASLVVRARDRLRELAPDAVEPDGRVWPQIVDRAGDAEFHALLEQLAAPGSAPLVFVSDFALRGSPLVRNEADAVEAFGRSSLDALIAGTRIYER